MIDEPATLKAESMALEEGSAGAPAEIARAPSMSVPLALVSSALAAVVLGSFFLPWMEGAGPFGERSFSGFDFARLVRNFELAADSATDSGQVRGTAVALYLIPAAAINGAFLHVLASIARSDRAVAGWALVIGGAYALLLIGFLLAMSVVPFNDFAGAVGTPTWGYATTALAALGLVWCGRRESRS